MSDIKIIANRDDLVAIADAIRTKTGKTDGLTLNQMPSLIEGITTGSDGSPRMVKTAVNIAVGTSFTVEILYTHFLYNGVRLPRIPDDVLARYPYAWIRNNTRTGNFDLLFSEVPWYLKDENTIAKNNTTTKWYQVAIASADTAQAWTANSDYSSKDWGNESDRRIMWSNHDIPYGSATATDIYFAGSKPVPTD